MTSLVIPIGGLGTRFSNAGFTKPKPMIEIFGEPMIVKAISPFCNSYLFNNVYIGIRNFDGYKELMSYIQNRFSNVHFLVFDHLTSGPATTVYNIIQHFDIKDQIFTINCDQIVRFNIEDLYEYCTSRYKDGVVVTFDGGDNRHSFLSLDSKGVPKKFTEKVKISNIALTGIHYFRHDGIFSEAYGKMIQNDLRAPNGEYYMSLMYNYIQGTRYYHIPKQCFWPVGTPEELKEYIDAHI